jgi:hypothetical protein
MYINGSNDDNIILLSQTIVNDMRFASESDGILHLVDLKIQIMTAKKYVECPVNEVSQLLA